MNRKSLSILILVAGILVVLAFVGQGRNGSGSIAGDTAGRLLIPALNNSLNDIELVSIDGAGRQRLVSLERVSGDWMVAEVGGYPAERSEINALLIALAEARIVEEKTANPESHALLGVEDIDNANAAGFEIALSASGGERFEVVLGGTYGASQIYARMARQNQSVLIDRNPEISGDPADWVLTDIIAIANDRVQRVEISHSDGERVEIVRESPDIGDFNVENLPDGRDLQYAGVANVTANLLQGLQLDAVERRSDDETEQAVVSEFWMFDGLVITVSVAGENEDAWLAFNARVEPDQALSFASEIDATAEAEAINLRLAEWQYQIPSYQVSQLTRRMEDLLLPTVDE